MQVDKTPFPMHMVEAGAPTVLIHPEQADKAQGKNVIISEPRGALAILIHPEQADKAQGKNVIIGEPCVAPNVEMNSGRKVVLEKDDEGKNKLKITAGSTQYLKR